MALDSDYIIGTISLTNGLADFTGTGTAWQHAKFTGGDTILDLEGGGNLVAVIGAILSDTSGTLTRPWEGPTLVDVAYRMRYHMPGARLTAQSTLMIEQLGNGNVQSFSTLEGPGVPVFVGPHALLVKPESDFVNGVTFDVQVANLAGRAPYNGQPAGFKVLVSDNGDGRSAIYSKVTNTSGDWSPPAYITGPVGPEPEITASVDMLAPGAPAVVNVTPIAGGYNLDFELPAAEGMQPRGPWSNATAYIKGDVVSNGGSSYVAKRSNTGVAPGENADWGLLAAKGTDGTGSGDVAGPAGATSGNVAVFADATGKVLGGGFPINEIIRPVLAQTTLALARQSLGANDAANLNAGTLPDARVSATLTADKAFRRGNILGAVSLAGSIPSGALLQLISNANGVALRFADGTQICWRNNMPLTNAVNSDSKTGTWTFPAAFINADSVVIHNPDSGSSWNDDQGIYRGQSESVEQVATTNCRVIIGRQTGLWDSTKTVTTRVLAIGRWA